MVGAFVGVMPIRRVLGTAALALVCATSLASSSSADSAPLDATVTPDDINDGSAKLSFVRTSFNRDDGTSKATMKSNYGRAEVHIDNLTAPAVVRCAITTQEDARIQVSEYLDGGKGYGETGQTVILAPGLTEVEFIAEPNPSGDYMYRLRADEGPWSLTQCTVEGLS